MSLGDAIIASPYFYSSFIPTEYIEEKTLKQRRLDLFVEECWRVSVRVLFANKVREYFPNAILEKREWIDSVGFDPPKTFKAKHPNDFVFKFDKVSCQEIASYCSVLNREFPCTKDVDGGPFLCSNLYLKEAVQVCQPNCCSEENSLDTVWDPESNKCLLTNVILKTICLNPTGGDGSEQQERGPPLLWDNLKSTCNVSPEYCEFYGEEYDPNTGTCTNPIVVNVAEFVLGKTISRTVAHPINTFKRKDTAFDCKLVSPRRKREDTIQTVTVITQLSEMALKQTYKYARSLKPLVRNNVLLHEAIRISGKQLFKPALVLLRIFNGPVGWALLAADVIGAVSDYIDPRNLKSEMSKGDLESVTRMTKAMYKEMYLDLTRRDRADSFFDNINSYRQRRGRGRKRYGRRETKNNTVVDDQNENLLELLIDQYMILNSDKFMPNEEMESIFNEYLLSAGADLNESTRLDYVGEFLNSQNIENKPRIVQQLFQNIKRNWSYYGILFLFVYLTFKMVKGYFILINDIWSIVIIFICTIVYMLQGILSEE
jgi:hypothetical protein